MTRALSWWLRAWWFPKGMDAACVPLVDACYYFRFIRLLCSCSRLLWFSVLRAIMPFTPPFLFLGVPDYLGRERGSGTALVLIPSNAPRASLPVSSALWTGAFERVRWAFKRCGGRSVHYVLFNVLLALDMTCYSATCVVVTPACCCLLLLCFWWCRLLVYH
ncbi:hypothetical protein NPIL_609051 [Nephila pilipes]|uniref:Uncharacterized protein n=1 Tax=Nephila pilipes TaxID=299642 RepID=A0A8X6PZ27_NEPPI|nr:hypothetical protein NPIL_609051 [Nephila pilipes]